MFITRIFKPRIKTKYPIFITGAGTGGHVLTAISIYDAILQKQPKLKGKILYVGSINLRKGMQNEPSLEEELCKERKIPFVKIKTGKVQRFLELRTLKLLLYIPIGFFEAFKLVAKYRPKIVIATGGYVTPPILFWAKIFGAKTFLHEQTMSPGLASRVASRFADYIMVSFKGSIREFKGSEHRTHGPNAHNKKPKIVYTGYPVQPIFKLKTYRQLILFIKKQAKRLGKNLAELGYTPEYLEQLKFLETTDKPIIFLTGGSTGSHALNEAMFAIFPQLLKDYIVIVQTGDSKLYNDYEKFVEFKNYLPQSAKQNLIVKKFLKFEMGYLLHQANLVISRSGAGIVYQLGMLKKPSILIPLPNTSGNEQVKNAKELEKLGIATILYQKDLTPETLLEKINFMLLEFKGKFIPIKTQDFPQNASEKIAKLVVENLT